MAVKGIFVSDGGALAERTGGFSNTILYEERGGATPFFALSAGMSETKADNSTVTWYEEGIWHTRAIITAVSSPTGNLITVEDSSWMTENMIFIVEATGEHVHILGISGNVLTVQRGLSGTGVAPIVVGGGSEQAIQCIGTAFEEASERPTAVATNPYPRTNITQIFRNSWDISRTAKSTTYRHGDRKARNKQTAAMIHATLIEYSLLFGRRHMGVINNKPYRQMDGVLAQLRSNIFIAPTDGLTRRSLDDYVERLFSKNIKGQPNERITFVGNAALRALNEIVWRYGTYNISVRENTFGINVRNFVTPFGDLTMIPHPLMNDSPIFSHDMYSLHPAAMEIAWLDKTFHLDEGGNGQASDLRDAEAGVFTSELTVKYGLEQTGAIMTGINVDHFAPCPCPLDEEGEGPIEG